MAVLQQRSSLVSVRHVTLHLQPSLEQLDWLQSLRDQYRSDLVTWALAQGYQRVLLLAGTDASERIDNQLQGYSTSPLQTCETRACLQRACPGAA